jgi:hypothetical protein
MIVSSFIIQAKVITIVNYDCKTFIVQATEDINMYGVSVQFGIEF